MAQLFFLHFFVSYFPSLFILLPFFSFLSLFLPSSSHLSSFLSIFTFPSSLLFYLVSLSLFPLILYPPSILPISSFSPSLFPFFIYLFLHVVHYTSYSDYQIMSKTWSVIHLQLQCLPMFPWIVYLLTSNEIFYLLPPPGHYSSFSLSSIVCLYEYGNKQSPEMYLYWDISNETTVNRHILQSVLFISETNN
jgi:hypothetical protein